MNEYKDYLTAVISSLADPTVERLVIESTGITVQKIKVKDTEGREYYTWGFPVNEVKDHEN